MTSETMNSKESNPTLFTSDCSRDVRYAAVFEDDGVTAYGYLLYEKRIVGDVWLYNKIDPPTTRPWLNRFQKPPFANPVDFVESGPFAPISRLKEVSFRWNYGSDGIPASVEIWLRNELHARIAPGSKPGWCRLAVKDGPLARRLS